MITFKAYLQAVILFYFSIAMVGCGQNLSSLLSTPAFSLSAQNQIDQLIKCFMSKNGITGGSITILHGARDTLYDKSYGYQNRA
jgi:hypothetical protein